MFQKWGPVSNICITCRKEKYWCQFGTVGLPVSRIRYVWLKIPFPLNIWSDFSKSPIFAGQAFFNQRDSAINSVFLTTISIADNLIFADNPVTKAFGCLWQIPSTIVLGHFLGIEQPYFAILNRKKIIISSTKYLDVFIGKSKIIIINSCSGTVPTGTPIYLWALCGPTAVSGCERSFPSSGRSWRYFYGLRAGIQLSGTEQSVMIPPPIWTKHAVIHGCFPNKLHFSLIFFASH